MSTARKRIKTKAIPYDVAEQLRTPQLRDDALPALGLTVAEAAQQLGVSRVALSRVLNGPAAISPEMALRIEAWLGLERGGEARLWLAEQSAYDVWQAQQRFKTAPMHVQPAPELEAA